MCPITTDELARLAGWLEQEIAAVQAKGAHALLRRIERALLWREAWPIGWYGLRDPRSTPMGSHGALRTHCAPAPEKDS